MENLKQKLLSLNIVEDNEWLDKYIKLIESNKETKREKFKTNRHHIIPRCYYNHNNLEIDNSTENLVNLLYKDHILAHYYLWNCSIDSYFKGANSLTVFMLTNTKPSNLNIASLNDFDLLYEDSCIYRSINMLGKFKGKTYVNKNGKSKCIDKTDLNIFLSDGWVPGNPLANSQSGKISLIKNDIEIRVYLEDMQKYLENGYTIGRKSHTRLGMHNSTEMRKKQSLSHLGRLKNTVHINNGVVSKMVNRNELSDYMNKGFVLGRLRFKRGNNNESI